MFLYHDDLNFGGNYEALSIDLKKDPNFLFLYWQKFSGGVILLTIINLEKDGSKKLLFFLLFVCVAPLVGLLTQKVYSISLFITLFLPTNNESNIKFS